MISLPLLALWSYPVLSMHTTGGVRPFGVSVLAAGYDKENGPQLFQIDPSGAAFGWKATAIGKNYVNAKNFLERRYNEVSYVTHCIGW
jgi:20S proteasome alpha/beta subunit